VVLCSQICEQFQRIFIYCRLSSNSGVFFWNKLQAIVVLIYYVGLMKLEHDNDLYVVMTQFLDVFFRSMSNYEIVVVTF